MFSLINSYAEYFIILLLFLLLVVPPCLYLIAGWHFRREEILSYFRDQTVKLYFRTFFPSKLADSPMPLLAFKKQYNDRFGRRHYVVPMIIFAGVAGISLILISEPLSYWLQGEEQPNPILHPIGSAAVAGAYMWVIYDLISRTRKRDLAPADLLWSSFRFVVSVPLAFTLSSLFKPEIAVSIAFLLGAFPTHMLFTLTRRIISSRVIELDGYPEESGHQLEKLQGIEKAGAERFGDEGVTTILQLAYSDPVGLAIRTNFSYSYVIDCCSQALAWLYFGDSLAKLRQFGLRGAQEITHLYKAIEAQDQTAINTLSKIAISLEQPLEGIHLSMSEIAGDPYTEFLNSVWADVG